MRRKALVRAGAEIMRDEGREAVTQRAVARRAGASLSAMTYYFADLEEMVAAAGREVLRDRIRDIVARGEAKGEKSNSAAEEIVAATLPGPGERPARVFVENLTRMGHIDPGGTQVDHFYSHVYEAIDAALRRYHVPGLQMPRQLLPMVLGSVVLTPRGSDPATHAVRQVDECLGGSAA